MWWGIGIAGGILYLIVRFTLGLMTLQKGHGWMFSRTVEERRRAARCG